MLWTLPVCAFGWFTVASGIWTGGTYIAFGGIVIFLIAFYIGMGGTVWAVNSEIYPLHVIGTAFSIATFTNWTTNFFVATVFPLVLHT